MSLLKRDPSMLQESEIFNILHALPYKTFIQFLQCKKMKILSDFYDVGISIIHGYVILI